jgi:protein-disulfide isomerase
MNLLKHSVANLGEYKRCLAAGNGADKVAKDIAFAREHEIQSTPTVFFDGIRNVGVMTLDGIRALSNLGPSKTEGR